MGTALITGASSGIGLELCRVFASHGHDLVLVSRREDQLNVVKEELESAHAVTCRVVPTDLSDASSPQQIYDLLERAGVEIDFLVNCAGFALHGPFHEAAWESEREMLMVNVLALAQLTKLFASDMVQRGHGRIMNVSSTAAFQPGPMMALYFSTKSFVLHFSEAIGKELKSSGVTVTALCPGATETPFIDRAGVRGTFLFQRRLVMPVQKVANAGFKAMMKGRPVAITGMGNYLLANSVRLMPRSITACISGLLVRQPE